MLNNNLIRWQNILSKLELNLECFTLVSIKYSESLTTLDSLELKKFVNSLGFNFPLDAILRTYRQQDRSYEIYAIISEDGIIYSLGRDFFAFIVDICIQRKVKDRFPMLFSSIGDTEIKDENGEYFEDDDPSNSDESTIFFSSPILEKLEIYNNYNLDRDN